MATSKKAAKKTTKKTLKKTVKKPAKAPRRKPKEPFPDSDIIIVDENLEVDQEKVNEERRAYLEEARSQEVFD